jgi:quercetin dioxygenase-like cupin family protein
MPVPPPAILPAAVAATVHGPTPPAGGVGQSLRLVRYDIAPGARLPAHRHEGTQVGLVAAGTLTYRVPAGRVPSTGRATAAAPRSSAS